ncbi:Branched-chain amino acid permease [Acidilobus saccharovorans 345-15]|uniref:Branched-chain amino acid permease n=1 Tax=Acidilobus saccharovorans (strain DSM 16705 / JCM 18335 / VKM B-2471 / 345-15) TaxID=666510 RepID=D9Q1S2_ACIS3|nr:ABC transporter substrate-binding protein [Acidilobus saccharovorans]ADL19260.1 Branched-chain amino acid permease [Acidilobus saccharovorans 345-15]
MRAGMSSIAVAAIIVIIIVAAVGGYIAYNAYSHRLSAAPKYILVGTVYDNSGSQAVDSLAQYEGLELWASWVNSHGGIYVKQYGRNLTVKVIALNAASNPSTAESDYETLVNTYHVDVLVADFGSVMTAPAVSFTNASHVLLWDVTASAVGLFTNNNYIIDTSIPVSEVWMNNVTDFLKYEGVRNVSVIWDDNDFNAFQSYYLGYFLRQYDIPVVYNTSVATDTTQYLSLISAMESERPFAVIELGYPTNDEAFLPQLVASKACFPLVFTNYPGLMLPTLLSDIGSDMNGTFTAVFPPIINYTPQVASKLGLQWFGPTLPQFEQMFEQEFHTSGVNYNNIAGFNAGLIIQLAIQDAGTLNQAALKQAVLSDVSGKVMTLAGVFNVTSNGMQVGEAPPIGQVFVWPNGTTTVNIVYPPAFANSTAVIPEPCP